MSLDYAITRTRYVRPAAFRVPVATFDFEEAERQLREHLNGKFFDVNGEDKIASATKVAQERVRDKRARLTALKAMNDAKVAAAAEAAAAELERQRKLFPGTTVNAIIAAVAYAHGVAVDDILSLSRSWNVVHARMHGMALAKEITGKAATYIGTRFGRDHSTVLHALREWPHRLPRFIEQDRMARLQLGVE